MGPGKQANEHTLAAMLSKAFFCVSMCGKKCKCDLFLIKSISVEIGQLPALMPVSGEFQLHIDPHAGLCLHTL